MKKALRTLIAASLLIFCAPSAFAADGNAPSAWSSSDVQTAITRQLVPVELQSNYTESITREEFTELITQVAKAWYPTQTLAQILADRSASMDTVTFTDTQNESVRFCAALGIVSGSGNGLFQPNDPITRQQAAKILMKAANLLTQSVQQSYQDTTNVKGVASWQMPHTFTDGALLRSWGRAPVTWCYRTGIMQGVGQNQFNPNGNYTREQSILTALRLFYINGQEEKITSKGDVDYYPLNGGVKNLTIETWIDSSLGTHPSSELSYIDNLNSEYGFIIDNEGVGVTLGHIINRKGERQFTDLFGTDGNFYNAVISGERITLYLNPNLPRAANAPDYFTIDTKTGKIQENVEIEVSTELQSPLEIRAVSSGWYALYNSKGQKLSANCKNMLCYLGGNLYASWVADYPCTYRILYCDGNSEAKVIRTEVFRNSPWLISLGGGVYAYQRFDNSVCVVDAYGDILSTIVCTSDEFLGNSNGLVVIYDLYGRHEDYYYTQDGTKVLMQ